MGAADPIRPEVKAEWLAYNEPFEGRLRFMYCDVKGLVTTGVGNLIDPVAVALRLPWKRPDGSRATLNEIQDAWIKVKGRTDLCKKGGGAFAKVTTLRLDDADVDALVFARLGQMAHTIANTHPCFSGLPADAQIAILSMAWAMGPLFHFPHFWAAIEAGDWETAAQQCTINPQVGTIIKRNAMNAARLRACLGAAA